MDNQLSFVNMTETVDDENTVKQNKVRSVKDNYDCCSLYRECSNNRKCVYEDNPCSYDPEKHLFCNYRNKLNQGIIYYGKNAPEFSADIYKEYTQEYYALTDEQKKLLKDIYYHVAICSERHHIIDRNSISESLIGSILINIREPNRSDIIKLFEPINNNLLRTESGFKGRRKVEHIDYIIENCPEIVNKYCNVLFAELDYNQKRYAVEIFHDYMR